MIKWIPAFAGMTSESNNERREAKKSRQAAKPHTAHRHRASLAN